MDHKISEDRKTLTITVNIAERMTLKRMDENELQSDDALWEFLEPLLCNSELSMIDSAATGDLTDAPMLCTTDVNGVAVERWAFMDRAVRSPLEDLRDKGEVIFVGGPLT